MNNIQVSVIIPVYNVEQYLKKCLDTVVNQTYKDIEIIIINDCSPDNSLQIIKEYQEKDSRIRLINLEKNGGLANARNVGIKNSNGKYITFIDSDDWISDDAIEILYNNVEKYNTDFLGCEFTWYDNNTHKSGDGVCFFDIYNTPISDVKTKKRVLQKFSSSRVWGFLFKKDFLISSDIYFRINRREDILFMYEAIVKSTSFALIKDRLYYYRSSRIGSNINTNTLDADMLFYVKLQQLHKSEQFKDYIKVFYRFISLAFALALENHQLPYKKASEYFFKFRELFYDKNYIVDFSDLRFFLKIRLLVFLFCLKYKLNYSFIGKLHNKFNPIRIFTHNNHY
jgi:glycosyltransferase involved in cell wall biosynthesis